jgi:hypothetical protein
MANANVLAAAHRLKHAIKALQDHWLSTEAAWSDSVRWRFEQRYLSALDPAIDSALNGMRKIADVLDQIRRDCSDRSELP